MSTKLERLAALFRKNREEAALSVERAVQHSIAAGEALIEAKKHVRHGEWLPWLRANCEVSERTARSYMQLARAPLEERQRVADLPLREALAVIAKRPHRCMADRCPAEWPQHDADCELAALEPFVAVCCGAPVRRVCFCNEPYRWEDTGEICAVPRDHRLARRWICN